MPLDAMREMEKSGVIGKLHDEFISTSGRADPLSAASPGGDGRQNRRASMW